MEAQSEVQRDWAFIWFIHVRVTNGRLFVWFIHFRHFEGFKVEKTYLLHERASSPKFPTSEHINKRVVLCNVDLWSFLHTLIEKKTYNTYITFSIYLHIIADILYEFSLTCFFFCFFFFFCWHHLKLYWVFVGLILMRSYVFLSLFNYFSKWFE